MIIKCPECGHEVSDKAELCPKCGYPINQHSSEPSRDNKNKKWPWIAVAAVAAVVLGIGAWLLLKSDILNDDDPNAIVELTPDFIEKVQQYDQLAPFSEGRAAVRRGSLWGYIDTKGNEVISCQYNRAELFHDGVTQVEKDDGIMYIDSKGDKLFDGDGGRFSEGLALLSDGRVVNTKGEVQFKVDLYDMAYSMSREPNQSTYTQYPYYCYGVIAVWGADAEYFYDINGKKIPESGRREKSPKFTTFQDVNYDDFISGNNTGLKDSIGAIIIPANYAEVSAPSNGVVLVSLRENDAYFFGEEGIRNGISDGMSETYTPRFYAFADFYGNTTFSDKTLSHIAEADQIGRERWSNIRRQQEEAKRNESREVYITMSVENNDRGQLVDVSGNYSVRVLPSNTHIATEKIKVPDGKVWVYEGVLEMDDAFMSPCAYSIDGSDNRAKIIWGGSKQVPSSYRDDGYFRKGRCGLPLNDRFAVQGGDYLTIKSMFGRNRGRHTIKVAFRELDRDYYREKCGYNF